MPRTLTGHLTEAHLAVIRLAVDGHTSRNIARRLGLTETAVNVRLSTAARSLGARNRTHLIVLAHRAGHINLNTPETP